MITVSNFFRLHLHNNSPKWSFIFLLLSLPFHTLGQDMTLKECISFALENSTSIKEAEISREEILMKVRQEKRFMIPEINAYANYWQYLGDFPVYYFPESEGNIISGGNASGGRYPVQLGQPMNFMTGLELNQKLFDARFFMAKDVNAQVNAISDLTMKKEKEALVYDVSKVFMEVAILSLDMELILENEARLAELRPIVRDLVENEITNLNDLDELTINENRLRLNKRKLAVGISQKTSYLKLIMGMSADQDVTLRLDPGFALPDDSTTNSSLDLELINSNIELNKSRFKMENSRGLPYLDLYLKAQWQQQQDYGDLFSTQADWYNLHIAGLKLSIPILGVNQKQTRKEEMLIQNQKLGMKKDIAERAQDLMITKSLEDLVIARETIQVIEEEVSIREAQRNRAKQLYQEGVGSLKELLDAESEVTTAKLDLNRSLLELELAKLELLKSQNNLLLLVQ